MIGSSKSIFFKVISTNHGEPAYRPSLDIFLHGQTRLQGKTANELCQKPVMDQFGSWRYSCRLGVNPLKRSKSVKFQKSNNVFFSLRMVLLYFAIQDSTEFELDVTSLMGGTGGDSLTVLIESRIGTAAAKGSLSIFNLTIPLKSSIDVEVVG